MQEFKPSEQILLKSLNKDFRNIEKQLWKLSELMINQKISRFPIFIACDLPLSLGIKIQELPLTYFEFRASHLQEFIQKKLIASNAIAHFQSTYPNPLEKACIFIVTENFQKFIFVPYQQQKNLEP
ncbi:MAG: hypothetical protein RML72_10850 [Bacteroidia bacterium]|nr:hypothetical protein [Bacteroidia bacterium]MDW8159355.1 hypothetical protein [Bacteroidia bacterium]